MSFAHFSEGAVGVGGPKSFSRTDPQDDMDDDEDEEVSSECKKTLSWEMSSKNLSTAMWLILVKEECIERGILSAEYLGPKLEAGIRVTFQRSLENFMERVDNWR